MRDTNGQPRRAFRAAAVEDRKIDELIGLCRGVLADGVLMQSEAEFLLDWLARNRDVANRWPANVIYERIDRALADGVMDEEEERALLETLMDVTGEPALGLDAPSLPARLPLDDPPPLVTFAGRTFCFTGKFLFGSRGDVEGAAKKRGALVCATPNRRTDYLVIGAVGSRDWMHSTFGRKIEKAAALRAEGCGISVLTEELWVEAINQ